MAPRLKAVPAAPALDTQPEQAVAVQNKETSEGRPNRRARQKKKVVPSSDAPTAQLAVPSSDAPTAQLAVPSSDAPTAQLAESSTTQPAPDNSDSEPNRRSSRSTRNPDPAAPARPKARKTSEQVQREKQAAKDAKTLAERENQRKLAVFDSMELELQVQKEAEREMVETRRYDLSVVDEGEEGSETVELANAPRGRNNDGEFFDFSGVDKDNDASGEEANPPTRGNGKRGRGRGGSHGRGRGGKAPGGKRKQTDGNESDSVRANKQSKSFPTGLKTTYTRGPHNPETSGSQAGNGDTIGGLRDSDAEDSAGLQQGVNRVVGFTSTLPAPARKAPSRKQSASKPSGTPKPPSPAPVTPPSTQNTPDAPAAVITKANAALRKADLPGFIIKDWEPEFTHTVRHQLLSQANPLNVRRNTELLATIQDLITRLYPGISYHAGLHHEPVFELSYRKITECRTTIASTSIDIVQSFFKQGDYAGKPDQVKLYCTWALRNDGPAIYSLPTPSSCTAKQGEPGYQYPDGAFESYFIVQVMRKISILVKRSKVDFGHPVGAVAMVAAAIERAFKHFEHDDIDCQPQDQFTADKYSPAVSGYAEYLSQFSERRWRQLLDLYEFDVQPISSPPAETSLGPGRRQLFIPASPTKGK